MRDTRLIMGMPITIEVVGGDGHAAMEAAFRYFGEVDARFSPYKAESELSVMNRGELPDEALSSDMRAVLTLAEDTRRQTRGYFDIRRPDGEVDPSGLVKGWAIREAARVLERNGITDFIVDAGGDIECRGTNGQGEPWRVGIRNPFHQDQIVKVVVPGNGGVATSGHYVRGAHIYDPHTGGPAPDELASITIIGPDVYEADRFATAAFAMGRDGINFVEEQDGLEGYAIDRHGIATMTSGFERFVAS